MTVIRKRQVEQWTELQDCVDTLARQAWLQSLMHTLSVLAAGCSVKQHTVCRVQSIILIVVTEDVCHNVIHHNHD